MIHATDPGALERAGRLARLGATCALVVAVSTGFASPPDQVGNGPDADSTQSNLTLTIRSAPSDEGDGAPADGEGLTGAESHSGALSNENDPSSGSQSSFDVDPIRASVLEPSAAVAPSAAVEPTPAQPSESFETELAQRAQASPGAPVGESGAERSLDPATEAESSGTVERQSLIPATPLIPSAPSVGPESDPDAGESESGEELVALGRPSEKAMAGATTTGDMPWQALLTGTLAAAAVTVGLRARRQSRSR